MIDMQGLDAATFAFSVFGGLCLWTSTAIALGWWMASRFRRIEVLLFREIGKITEEYDAVLAKHRGQIQRLELKAFGFTSSGNGHPGEPT